MRRDAELAGLVASASLIVPDGMPLLWAARLRGDPLPERVTGASMIFSLSAAAAAAGRSVYLLGGAPGVPDRAGAALAERYPGLVVAGADSPPMGFDKVPEQVADARDKVVAAAPDIVFVGLGFPKQERLITELAPLLPRTWFVACGAAIAFAAGAVPRAPRGCSARAWSGCSGWPASRAGWPGGTWSTTCRSPPSCWPAAPRGG